MDVFLRSGDDRSLVTQIHDQLRDAIADGGLPIGTRLTPSRVLAAEWTYAARHQTVMRELRRLAPPDARVLPTQTGLHVTLLTPGAPDDDVLVERAAAQDLIFSSLRQTYQVSQGLPQIIVGFGAIDTTDVPTAIERLVACLR
ncbi:MAG TPA: hypothetical protein VG455_12020 [Acidimicrobiales bacterium]|nr:hypothetical protein [Acidimicrobiales bacterium]